MGMRYYISCHCDKCGAEIRPLTKAKSEADLGPIRWQWYKEFREQMVLRSANLYQKIYCAKCAGT
jgi:hypothetical protein